MTISLLEIGQWIVDQRKKRGMTQLDLAEEVGVSPRTLSKIENGYDMKMSLFLAITEAVGADASEILSLSSEAPTLTDDKVHEIELHLQAIKQILGEVMQDPLGSKKPSSEGFLYLFYSMISTSLSSYPVLSSRYSIFSAYPCLINQSTNFNPLFSKIILSSFF